MAQIVLEGVTKTFGKTTAVDAVERAASLVQLSDLLDRYPAQLSGGQRQRVAVARAIVMEPAVLLMDELLSNLDALLRLTFRAELKKLVSELGTTAIYVTHDHSLELPAGVAAGAGETLVGIRAENIVPATEPSPGALPARTQVVEPLGSHLLLTASIGEQVLKVVAPVDFPAHPNRDLWLRLEPAKLRLFDVNGDRRAPASSS
jgi:multiple sugar transport system ATP-binding protein